MKPRVYLTSVLAIASIFSSSTARAQVHEVASRLSISNSSTNSINEVGESAAAGVLRPVPERPVEDRSSRPFTSMGFAWHTGINGVGFDMATPVTRTLNVRAGADFFRYSFAFQEEGAEIDASFRLRSGHASVDWFPFGGRFRVSPLMVFGNNNQVAATALIPSGSTLSINGQDYISSFADPLHGSGVVSFRKLSPGLSFGFGNMVPRTRSRISFPVEAGFYYSGQPFLKVDFSGSACDPQYPASIGCQPVMQDPGFQRDLASFIARNSHNLSYASFFPIFSVGVSYSFRNWQGSNK